MRKLLTIGLLAMMSSTSLAGFSCPGGEVDKWGHCEEYSTIGRQFYIDGLASCLHPCALTEAQLVEQAKINAHQNADHNQSCGYKMVRAQDWINIEVSVVTEETKVWTLAKIGAIFSCQ